MLTPVCQQALDLDDPSGDLIGHREVLERLALNAEVVMFATGARAVEKLQIDYRAGANEAAIGVGGDDRPDLVLAQACPHALIG